MLNENILLPKKWTDILTPPSLCYFPVNFYIEIAMKLALRLWNYLFHSNERTRMYFHTKTKLDLSGYEVEKRMGTKKQCKSNVIKLF